MPLPGASLALSLLEQAGLTAVDAIFSDQPPFREVFWQSDSAESAPSRLSQLVPDVVVEEEHYDEVETTDQPVEQGAAITDHAFKRPAECTVRFGWSQAGQATFSLVPTLGDNDYLNRIYDQLLTLQAKFQLVGISTGRRLYMNMLIKAIETRTDEKTANVLLIRVRFRQVIIVQTQVISVPDMSSQQRPQKTAADENQGTKSLVSSGGAGTFTPPSTTPPANPFQAPEQTDGWDQGFVGPTPTVVPGGPTITGTGIGALP